MEQNSANIIRGYSKAVFAVASEFNSREQFLLLLENLSGIIKDPRITKIINNGILGCEEKVNLLLILVNNLMNNLADHNNILPSVNNLIKLLAKNKHLLLLPKIYVWYDQLYLQSENKLKIEITSAVILNKPQKDKIYLDLLKYFNKEILLEYKTDSSIIAGIIIKYNDEVMDYSFKKKLLNLQHELLG